MYVNDVETIGGTDFVERRRAIYIWHPFWESGCTQKVNEWHCDSFRARGSHILSGSDKQDEPILICFRSLMGVKRNALAVIRDRYLHAKSSVKTNQGLSRVFYCMQCWPAPRQKPVTDSFFPICVNDFKSFLCQNLNSLNLPRTLGQKLMSILSSSFFYVMPVHTMVILDIS